MVFGEYLTGIDTTPDQRGVYWFDEAGSSQLFTANTPNSPLPDAITAGRYCLTLPQLNLPWVAGGWNGDQAASRSRHDGGVFVAMCDGSVHFVADEVSPTVWQAFGSIAGGEVAELD